MPSWFDERFLTEGIDDAKRGDVADRADREIDGDDEPVVAVSDSELAEEQTGKVGATRDQCAEPNRSVFDFPEPVGGHASVGYGGGDHGPHSVFGRGVSLWRPEVGSGLGSEMMPIQPATSILVGNRATPSAGISSRAGEPISS